MPSDSPNETATTDYWNRFYKDKGGLRKRGPSQFAAFVLGELNGLRTLLDIGCGDGADSFFFSSHGLRVVGVDASRTAIDSCFQRKITDGDPNIDFLCSAVEEPGLTGLIKNLVGEEEASIVYARFFLHAINEEQEDAFFRLARAVCRKEGALALEFRTLRDASQRKVTPDHFRRFLDPLQLLARAQQSGFTTKYFVEGFGFAKFGADDAYVARCILRATHD